MTMFELVSSVQEQTGTERSEILRRAREAWPTVIDFKPVQVALMAGRIKQERQESAKAVMIGAVSRPRKVVKA